jgi:hypothetical protein
MHEIIEHGLVVVSNGEKVNLEEMSPAGIHRGCNTKDTVFACRIYRNNIQHIQLVGVFTWQSFADFDAGKSAHLLAFATPAGEQGAEESVAVFAQALALLDSH